MASNRAVTGTNAGFEKMRGTEDKEQRTLKIFKYRKKTLYRWAAESGALGLIVRGTYHCRVRNARLNGIS